MATHTAAVPPHEIERSIAELERHRMAIHSLAVMDHEDRGAAIQATAEELARALDVARASVWVYDAHRTTITCLGLVREGEYSTAPTVLDAAAYPAYFRALRENRSIDAHDARSDARTREFREGYLEPLGITSMLDVALWVGGESIGVVCAEHVGAPRRWTAHEGDLMTSASALLAVAFAIERQRSLQDQLRQSQKMEAVGLLAGGVAHDVNNVLHIILGEAELAEEAGADARTVSDALVAIKDAARRAAGLSRKLLTFSRQRPMVMTPTDVGAVVSEFERMARRVAGEAVEVVVRCPGTPLPVLADVTLLEQVLLNLAVNARQAMPAGGRLSIVVEVAPPGTVTPDVTADVAEAFARITLSDSGVGMSGEVLDRIWEPFFTTRELGSGLGLAIVHGAVRQMRGFVTVASTPGVGTTFALHLPLVAASTPAAGAPPDRPVSRGGPACVLLAEDDAMVRRVLATILRRSGITVVEASSGLEAHARFAEDPLAFDVLVSDVAMPGLDGYSAYRRMLATRPTFPALFLSGYAPEGTALDGLDKAGAPVRWLSKPVARETLLRGLEALLGQRFAPGSPAVATGSNPL